MSPPKILVVEDNPITRKMVRFALEAQGWAVVEAADGASALRAARSAQPDLVLQDLMLGDMDGFRLVSELRRLPHTAKIPILACSGFLSKLEEARVSSVGFDDVVVKPVEPSKLVQIIRGHLPIDEGPRDLFGRGRRIIVADDDPVQLKLATFRLERAGFVVTAVNDGAEALECACADPPVAILSDVMMPRLDGFGLCQAVRADRRLTDLPVVLATNSYVDPADRELAARLGADDLVVRTPDLSDLFAALKRSLDTPAAKRRALAAPIEVEAERNRRVMLQLERQVSLNAGMAQRSATLAAQLSVLTSISEALCRGAGVDAALDDVLAATVDAAGVSVGALYLLGSRAALEARVFGEEGAAAESLRRFHGREDRLRGLIEDHATIAVPSDSFTLDEARSLFERPRLASALIVPLLYGERALGALLLLSESTDLVNDGRLQFAQSVANQITQSLALAEAFREREQSEREARDRAVALRAVIDGIADSVVVADREGRLTLWNPAARQRLGAGEDALARLMLPDKTTPVPPAETPLARALRGESVNGFDLYCVSPGGAEGRFYSVNAHPMCLDDGSLQGAVAVFRDVTVEKAAQEQLLVSDRMASIGMLAAGVAHEINNPLAAVMANLDVALKDAGAASPGQPDLLSSLRDAREGASRVRQIVKDLKIFSRSEEDKQEAVDLRKVLDSSARMAWNEIRHRARLVKDYGEVPDVFANEARLGQVFLNLLVNAAQAIPEGHANVNEIRLRCAARDDGHAVVEVADTGEGMPPEVVARLFTPFFTTKAVGVGTGLGLSICQRIVAGAGGQIQVESRVGAGTTFRVLLPVAKVPSASTAAPAVHESPGPSRRARVLVVDDEPSIALAIRRGLSREHDVRVTGSAVDALELLRAGDRFDVILCDLMMPVVTGMEFHATLAREAPDQAQRIVFLTGGAFTAGARAFLDAVANPRIEKPFDFEELRDVVRRRS